MLAPPLSVFIDAGSLADVCRSCGIAGVPGPVRSGLRWNRAYTQEAVDRRSLPSPLAERIEMHASPYNRSLLNEILKEMRRYEEGSTSLDALQSFVGSRINLFDNDGSGARVRVDGLEADIDITRHTSSGESPLRGLDFFAAFREFVGSSDDAGV